MANYDLIVIGAGPAGYVGAIRAAQLGKKVAVVDFERGGGTCNNYGCIPTKALLKNAELYHDMKHRAAEFGFKIEGLSFDWEKIIKRSRDVSQKGSAGLDFLFKKNKIDFIRGTASLDKAGEVKVALADGKMETHTAAKILIATGCVSREMPGFPFNGKTVISSKDALQLPAQPKSVIVIGAGAIGIEFAYFYRTMGVDVTVVEVMPQVMPVEDAEVSKFAQRQFEKQGMKILLEAKVTKVEKGSDSITATVEKKDGTTEKITADRMISAVGVQGNIENLGLEALGVRTERGCVVVDGYGRTNVPGIYAIGDVAGPPMLAHKAEHEGVICIEKIAEVPGVHALDKGKIPGCTYCSPQVASVGLTEQKAKAEGRDIRVGRFLFGANGKAIALGEDQGFIKTIFDRKTGELLGAHMIGAEVTELIQGFVVAMNLETTEEELMHTVFPHPTLSEMMKESVLDAYGRALNA